jgi:hypothetical protein
MPDMIKNLFSYPATGDRPVWYIKNRINKIEMEEKEFKA